MQNTINGRDCGDYASIRDACLRSGFYVYSCGRTPCDCVFCDCKYNRACFEIYYKDTTFLPFMERYFARATHIDSTTLESRTTESTTPKFSIVESSATHKTKTTTFSTLSPSVAALMSILPSDSTAPIILAQSDTTAGFLSYNAHALNAIKLRPYSQAILRTFSSLRSARDFTRIPPSHRRFVRYAKKTSFIIARNHRSFRVVCDPLHKEFLCHIDGLFSTSANRTKEPFSLEFALRCADIVVLDSRGICAATSSAIFTLSHNRKKRIRW